MSNNKNTLTLYRFVSLRNPELSVKKNQSQRFVFHPDAKKSTFYKAASGSTNTVINWEKLQSYSTNYKSLNGVFIENESLLKDYFISINTANTSNADFITKAELLSRNKSKSKAAGFFKRC